MSVKVNVGHVINMALQYLDTNGNSMLTAPVPDAPPTWSNGNSAVDTLVAAADGNSATDTAVAPGTDTVSVSLTVGGVAFSATLAVEVDAAPQVLGSVVIVPTVV